jgi:serine/threonine-protein kinase RsbT
MCECNRCEKIHVSDEISVINVRHIVQKHVKNLGFGVVSQTKIITATSELARNIERYARKGTVCIEHIERNGRKGLKLTFEDMGPGIPDISKAMEDGYSSSGGLGLGLPGTKRLMDEFKIKSVVGQGTVVTIAKWVE